MQQPVDDDIYPMIVPDDEAETLIAAPPIPTPHPPSSSIAPVSLTSRALPARRNHAFASGVTMAGILCLAIGGAAACLVVRTPLKEQAHVGASLDESLLLDLEQPPPAEKPAERATLTRVTLPPLSDAPPSDPQFLRRPSPPQLATRY
jgi:hypothetical protein